MDINLIVIALVFLVIIAGSMAAIGALVWLVKRGGSAGPVPVPIGRNRAAAEGEPVRDCEVSVRSYTRRRGVVRDTPNDHELDFYFEADVTIPLPDDLQLYCSLGLYGPADIPGGLMLGLDDLEQTFRVYSKDPAQTRTFFDAPDLVDALCDLAYDADETRLQPGFLIVKLDERPAPDKRRAILDGLARAVKALEQRDRELHAGRRGPA
ncbi:hypothetical protein FIV42_00865 [Persicimonas caeni]|uniref:Uncharacterized protein n=1 Tax=Persicimonas caeni TaxID=2292766 RepID=A0A4Y6PNF0_PERCE|nr:hypothetical protein [Persicimonas caeni]QDG49335.1 hypothetical protein FIV42_00865 [Persicimonas caeni]QED30556.1 hypothetical protein FRD00_00860 [Persicimonas caeni]